MFRMLFIDHVASKSREIMHLVGLVRLSVHPFAHLFARRLTAELQIWSKEESLLVEGVCLCVCSYWVCVDNQVDAVDQLLACSGRY